MKIIPEHVVRDYQKGRIGWREACRRLDLEKFSDLEFLLKKHGLSQYEPDGVESAQRISELDNLLYDDGER